MSQDIYINNLTFNDLELNYEQISSLIPSIALIKAIYSILCNRVHGKFLGKSWKIKVSAYNSENQEKFSYIQARLHKWYFSSSLPLSYLLAISGIVDLIFIVKNKSKVSQKIKAERVNLAAEFYDNWCLFLVHLELSLDSTPPYTFETLQTLVKDDVLYIELFEKLISCLQTYLSQRINFDIAIVENITYEMMWEEQDFYFSDPDFLISCFTVKRTYTNPTIKRIERAIARGLSVLLVGNTGVGKTEMAKTAALSQAAKLIKINGHPGLDDKALYGSVYPNDQGSFRFINGPLTEAFDLASQGHSTILLIDEICRFDPYYIAVLLGVFDELSGAEIKARPSVICNANTVIHDNQRYYLLCLPNGTYRIALVNKLTIIATTNLGQNYSQAIQLNHFDSALMRRFRLHIDCKHLSDNTQIDILINQLDIPHNAAETMVKLADFSKNNTATEGGLLRQEANLGVLFNWGEEAKSLFTEENYNWKDALLEAAQYTIIPFVVGRGSNGYLETPAVDMILDELKRIIKKGRG